MTFLANSNLILQISCANIDEYTFMCGSNFYETDVTFIGTCMKKFSNHEEMLWNLKLRLNYNVSLSDSYDFNYIYRLKPNLSSMQFYSSS